jgi:hypothetical protein
VYRILSACRQAVDFLGYLVGEEGRGHKVCNVAVKTAFLVPSSDFDWPQPRGMGYAMSRLHVTAIGTFVPIAWEMLSYRI